MSNSIRNILAQDKVDLVQLNALMKKEPTFATPVTNVTFWGTRTVTLWETTITEQTAEELIDIRIASRDFEPINLNELAKKVLEIAKKRSDADDLTTKERIAGIDIAKKLVTFYNATDAQVKTSNFFTRFLVWIRELNEFLYPYQTRFWAEEILKGQFQEYSKENFERTFHCSMNHISYQHHAFRGPSWVGNKNRFIADEEAIRNLPV